MSIWGKIIGGMAGFAVGGPLGALIGAAAGHAYDSLKTGGAAEQPPELPPPGERIGDEDARRMAFSVGVIALGAKMAKIDGAVSRAEVNAFKEVFRIRPQDVRTVARIFDAAKRDPHGYAPYARQIGALFRHEPAVLEELLAGLFHIARADGEIGAAEMDYLRAVARLFGLDAAAFARVHAAFAKPQARDAYAVLGLDHDAADDEIKKTYRRLIRENHPDTLIAKGMPEEFVAVATQRMAAINAAYDQIERERGLK